MSDQTDNKPAEGSNVVIKGEQIRDLRKALHEQLEKTFKDDVFSFLVALQYIVIEQADDNNDKEGRMLILRAAEDYKEWRRQKDEAKAAKPS